MNLYTALLRPILFRLPPETAHRLTLRLLPYVAGMLSASRNTKALQTPISLWGKTFPNRLGLAPGFDNDGESIQALFKLGFGFIELGGITPKAQQGNPQPRLYRLPEKEALINSKGFPNQGVDALLLKIKNYRGGGVLGVNIGKNKETSLEKAVLDYTHCIEKCYPYVDYLSLNLSSPNTPGLRQLNQAEYLPHLLSSAKKTQKKMADRYQRFVPLLLKISPDMEEALLKATVHTALEAGIEGFVATNTTLQRPGLDTEAAKKKGGLSGRPLFPLALHTLNSLHRITAAKIPIIAVGGILSAANAAAMIKAGASLVQIYTGLVYQGPQLIKEIIAQLHDLH